MGDEDPLPMELLPVLFHQGRCRLIVIGFLLFG